jgi:hypothetical protein
MSSQEHSVLQAAVSWARALEAQAQAEEEMSGQAEAEETLKTAEVELYVAILGWRAARN